MHKKETKNTQSWLLSKYTQIHPHSCRVRKHYTCTHTPSGLKDTYKITQINPSLPFKQILCCLSLCISTHTHTLESSASINIINLKSSSAALNWSEQAELQQGLSAPGIINTPHRSYMRWESVCQSTYVRDHAASALDLCSMCACGHDMKKREGLWLSLLLCSRVTWEGKWRFKVGWWNMARFLLLLADASRKAELDIRSAY